MYKINVQIVGITPIKFNRISQEALDNIDKGKRAKKDHKKELEDWKKKILSDKKGNYVESLMIRSCIINGLALPVPLVSNKVKIQKPKGKATVFINPLKCYIEGKVEPKPDVTWTQNKNAIGNPLVIVRRPIMKEWKIKFEITVTSDFLLEEVLKTGVARAGLCFGLGSHRPDFGRFVISKWSKNGKV